MSRIACPAPCRFLWPPPIIILSHPWNKLLVLYALILLVLGICICVTVTQYQSRRRRKQLEARLHQERLGMKEAPPPEKETEPVPFFKPTPEFLRKVGDVGDVAELEGPPPPNSVVPSNNCAARVLG